MNNLTTAGNYNVVCKLYNDKITLSRYTMPVIRYKKFDNDYKMCVQTGRLFPYTYKDSLKDCKQFEASLCRSRNNILELSERNKFLYFLTITLNPKYVDRTDPVAVHALFKNIIKRLKYHFKGIAYISVPEEHRDRESIHYHIMINFLREPCLKYQGRTDSGQKYYHFNWKLEKFKNKDCFFTLEKLETNNAHYLIKYMTKGTCCSIKRRYSTSRGLKRAILCDKINISTGGFRAISGMAKNRGFTVKAWNERTKTLQLCQLGHTGAPAPVDLSNTGIKDENLKDIFYKLIHDFLKHERIRCRIGAIHCKNYKTAENIKKLLHEQLTFDMYFGDKLCENIA